jgi:hypothetical protein
MGEGELDEAQEQLDIALIKLMGVDIKSKFDHKNKWSLQLEQ